MDYEERIDRLTESVDRLSRAQGFERPASKAAAIMALAGGDGPQGSDSYDGSDFGLALKAMYLNKVEGWTPDRGEILAGIKATLGDTNANGGYIIPLNTVGQVVEIAKARNIYRQLMNVVPGVRGLGVNQPYELDDSSLQRAQLQGGEALAYGSNKDSRDFTLGSATATLYPLARIISIGNQFLRQSEGAAERLVRTKLGRAFGLGEAYYILNGTGTNQPKGILTSFTSANIAAYSTALSSETRIAAIGRGIGALELRGYQATGVVVSTTDFWEMATETLGTSGSGGWALSPAEGASAAGAISSAWGVPVYRDPNLTAGSALIADWGAMDLYFGMEYRIDASDVAGNNFAQNLTSFRGEEEMGFNADAFILTGMVQKVTGI